MRAQGAASVSLLHDWFPTQGKPHETSTVPPHSRCLHTVPPNSVEEIAPLHQTPRLAVPVVHMDIWHACALFTIHHIQ